MEEGKKGKKQNAQIRHKHKRENMLFSISIR